MIGSLEKRAGEKRGFPFDISSAYKRDVLIILAYQCGMEFIAKMTTYLKMEKTIREASIMIDGEARCQNMH